MQITEGSLGPGFTIGHWTDRDALTGCTVILPPRGNVTSCDIRGSSPGERELVQLDPERRLTEIHGLVLTGGSAFGLAAATGVQLWLEEHGIGYQTPAALVPIVPAAVVFDLGTGNRAVRPGEGQGRAACDAAAETFERGRVGAGTGTTVGKWAGIEHLAPGGIGWGFASDGASWIAALAVVNAVGDVLAEDGTVLAGTSSPDPKFRPSLPPEIPANTVLAAITTSAALDKREVRWLAARGTDGVTSTIRPAHTRYDGDVTFAIVAPSDDEAPNNHLDVLGHLAREAVASAVRDAVTRR